VKYEYLNRLKGKSKINYFELYQIGINAIISNSILPIRVSSFIGFGIGLLCIIASIIFLLLKLIFWNFFQAGYAPVIISIFFLFVLIFIFIGFLGEYIGSLINYNKKKELIIEKERINFD
jgi:dolichol-phosphate mannosyltransferase